MTMTRLLLTGLLTGLLLPLGQAQAQTRDLQRGVGEATAEAAPTRKVALVIGNGAYQNTTKLAGPRYDVDAVSEALEPLDFEVIRVTDADAREFSRALGDFTVALRGAETALLYYSGHGIQIDGENYLIPVDADLPDPDYIRAETFSLTEILARMDYSGTKVNIVVLDACRNNPWAKSWTVGTRDIPTGGLAAIHAAGGFFIAYATSPNEVALDGGEGVGPYASALSAALATPGKELSAIFRDVGGSVQTQTSGRQIPWSSSSLVSDVYFLPPEGGGGGGQRDEGAVSESPSFFELLSLDLHLGLGLGAATGLELQATVENAALVEPAFKPDLPLELGLAAAYDLGLQQGWARLSLSTAPLLGGAWLYADDQGAAATRLSLGGNLSGGVQRGALGGGALVGVSWPGRLPLRALVRYGDTLGAELRLGINLTTPLSERLARPVEPAAELLLSARLGLRDPAKRR